MQWAEAGHPIFLLGRDTEELQRISTDLELRCGVKVWHKQFDSNEHTGHAALVREIADQAGAIEGFLIALGYMGDQSTSETDVAECEKVLGTNFVDVAVLCHACASHLEALETGWIAVLSSVAGDRGRMSNYVYGSAKGGLSVFLQGLRSRLQKKGVHVLTVKPGPVDTSMTFGMGKLPLLCPPEKVASDIVRAVAKRKDVLYTPGPWRLIMFILRSVPEWLFKKTSL